MLSVQGNLHIAILCWAEQIAVLLTMVIKFGSLMFLIAGAVRLSGESAGISLLLAGVIVMGVLPFIPHRMLWTVPFLIAPTGRLKRASAVRRKDATTKPK